ncbi:efflux transporter outer membrane subunit [Sphingomonas sp. SFZ2018-12]|uniref:efflux transporter outer membrane subunit n=1 Tax=Sphingomonas sp. SFZ2018-12 TaxID=2683197 RepID=UPI001F0FED7C|nr:efflux transporter outer membrane subunit [Sphingomonas sp. SFZ2018-12]MCH4892966.1 efflux transporter outer membrane subunit [Sphingomonas sp. SFZ2018-12]
MRRAIGLMLAPVALAGCSLAPKYERPAPPVAPSWPVGDAYLRQSEADLASLKFDQVFRDTRLRTLIETALANNRDLRVAAANIEAARAQYRIQRAELLPVVSTGGTVNRNRGGASRATQGAAGGATVTTFYTVNAGITAFELDLFGRIRSLSDAALNQFFATEAAARATRLTLVGDIATAWLTYAADLKLLEIAQETERSALRSVELTRARLAGGIAPRTDLRQAEQILAQAQSDLAESRTALAQDVNALTLLVGAPVDPSLLPPTIEQLDGALAEVPAGLDSSILLRRPDVVQAEYQLRAANARIGAARAALFPRISLTTTLGFASRALSTLFDNNSFNWSVAPNVDYDIFAGGRATAGVRQSRAQRDAARATYEGAIQTAFREVADALARRGTIDDQLRADTAGVEAAGDTARLTEARYRGGIDPFLSSLDAQRALYAAQRTLVTTRLAMAANLVTLYRTLGGDPELDARAVGAAGE